MAFDTKIITEFLQAVGVPVAILLMVMWYIGKRLAPKLLKQIDDDRSLIIQQMTEQREAYAKSHADTLATFTSQLCEMREANDRMRMEDRRSYKETLDAVSEAARRRDEAFIGFMTETSKAMGQMTEVIRRCHSRAGDKG